MSPSLKTVINDYLNKVEDGVSLLKNQTGGEHPLKAWGNKKIPQAGKLSDHIEYEFHGIGCALIFTDCEVDFDFGPEDRIDGFDLWRLNQYLSSCLNKYSGYNTEKLKSDFEEAVKSGAISKLNHSQSRLYFYA